MFTCKLTDACLQDAFARARVKNHWWHTHGKPNLRAHTRAPRLHRGRFRTAGCQIDSVHLNRYPIPSSEEKARQRERKIGGCRWIPPWIFRRQVAARKGVYSRHDNSLRNWIEWALSFAPRHPHTRTFGSSVYACECSGTRVRGLERYIHTYIYIFYIYTSTRVGSGFRGGLRIEKSPGNRRIGISWSYKCPLKRWSRRIFFDLMIGRNILLINVRQYGNIKKLEKYKKV